METLRAAENPIHCDDNFVHREAVSAAREGLVDGPAASTLARTFQALSDPTRIRLISALTCTELCVCDLAALLCMTQSAISHQLSSLRDLHLVKSRKAGREVFYTLDDEHIRELYQLALDHIQHTSL